MRSSLSSTHLCVIGWITATVHCSGSARRSWNRLQSILNSAARLILRIPKFDHISSAIRNELHWLPVRRRIDYKLCMMVRNSLTGSAPAYLAELCVPSSSRSGRQHLRSANRGDLLIPLFRTEYGRRGFSVAGPQMWNSLPPNIRQLLNKPELFKKSLKTFFFGSSAQRFRGYSSLGAL